MIPDLSCARVTIAGLTPMQAEKISAMLIADIGLAPENVLSTSGLDDVPKVLESRPMDAIILGGGAASDDGLEAIRQISAAVPTSAVFYTTDREDVALATEALAAGAQDVIVQRTVSGGTLARALIHGMERARLRAERRATSQRLVRLNEEMNRFLGMAAHDLRGPIGTIGGYADLVLADAGDRLGPENVEALEIIKRSSAAMVRLIEELLDVSRIESGKHPLHLAPVRLKELIGQSVRQGAKAAERKRIVIESACQEETIVVADVDKMMQVLDNLLSNAVKFSKPGSKVQVEGLTCGDEVEVRVRDFGPGISRDEAAELFTPFFRGSARPTAGESSTGLGLPIVKGIITEHQGQVGVDSEVGAGSTFWFRIPQHLH